MAGDVGTKQRPLQATASWLRRNRAHKSDPRSVPRSDDGGEFGERGRDAMAWAGVDAEFVVPAADILDECVPQEVYTEHLNRQCVA